MKNYMSNYLTVVNEMKGWFNHEVLLDVYDMLNTLQQETTGDLLEIGLFHGKSFIPLLGMAKPGEVCIGIDIFEDQVLNGDKARYKLTIDVVRENIIKVFNELPKNLKLVKQSSQSLTDVKLLELSTNNKFRFVSIDGCHTYDCTIHDLNLAANCITEDGVIILDDFRNPNWPGVKAAVDQFLNTDNNLQPIYCGSNKLILCSREVSSNFYNVMKKIESNNIHRVYIQHNNANMWKGVTNIYK